MRIILCLILITFFSNINHLNSQTKIYLQKENGVYYIPCVVNGLKMKFIFDSGASNVTISLTEALYMLKNNYLAEKNVIGTTYHSIANGDIQEGTKIILNSIVVGGVELRNVEASVIHTANAPLLLGQSALSKLGSFSFDYTDNSLTIYNTSEYKVKTSNYETPIRNNGDCIAGNCLNGSGTFSWPNGEKYTGEWKNNVKEGHGTMIYQYGGKYVGEWKDNLRNGKGKYLYLMEMNILENGKTT